MALYGRKPRWAMTERGRGALDLGPNHFNVGPSSLRWDGGTLVVDVNEVTVPLPSRLHGEIRFTPDVGQPTSFSLDENKRHHWWPYAPFGKIEANFETPGLSWSGHGYSDTNMGTTAMEDDFVGWTWLRANLPDGAMMIYEPLERSGRTSCLSFNVGLDGQITHHTPPDLAKLKPGFWGVKRPIRTTDISRTAITQTMVDAPFYTRDAVALAYEGEIYPAVHESLDLDRFRSKIVKGMLPFKMPRRAGWSG